MAVPHAPIVALRQGDDAALAFLTKDEALDHLNGVDGYGHEFGSDDFARWDVFDARGRQLDSVIGTSGLVQDLSVASEEDHAENVRMRVRRRSGVVRAKLDEQREKFEGVDESPLTLADEDIDFELFAWRLASVLRPGGSPSDPVIKVGHPGPRHSAGWWHNTFGH